MSWRRSICSRKCWQRPAPAPRILDTIPGTIKRREPGLSADTMMAISRDVAKVRNMAAAVTLDDLREEDVFEDQDGQAPDDSQEAGD